MVVMVVVWVNMVVVMMMRAWVRLRSFGGGLMVGSFSAIGLLVVLHVSPVLLHISSS